MMFVFTPATYTKGPRESHTKRPVNAVHRGGNNRCHAATTTSATAASGNALTNSGNASGSGGMNHGRVRSPNQA